MELPSITAEKGKIDKKGNCQILIRVSWQRSHIRQTTGFKCPQELFIDGLIDSKVDNAKYKNGIIGDQIRSLELQFMDLARKAPLTKNIITAVVSGNKGSGLTILKLYERLNSQYEGIMSPGTLRLWEASANKLNDYAPDIKVTQLDNDVMIRFEQHLRSKLLNKPNTVWSTMKTLRSMFGKAVTLEIVDENPFAKYKAPNYKQTQRNYLVPKEAFKIEQLADNKKANKTYRLVAAWWTLAYQSGMRDGDISVWDEEKMVRDGKLYFTDNKTKTPQYIPVHPGLKKAIERVRILRDKPTNEVCNRMFIEMSSTLGLPFKVSMHTARHSFAVGYLMRGGSLEVLQKLLGHKSIRTTSIYGQIVNSRIDEEANRVFSKKI